MKVLFVTVNHPPVTCGVGDYTAYLAREAARSGHEPMVLVGRHVGALPGADGFEGVRFVPGLPSTLVLRLIHVLRLVRRERPHVVSLQYAAHAFGRGGVAPDIAALPLLLRWVGRVRVVTTFHETFYEWAGAPRQRILGLVQRLQVVALMLGSEQVVVTTHAREARLRRWARWTRTTIVHAPTGPAIDSVPVDEIEEHATRARWGLGDAVVLATFGTLHPDKDLVTCVEAATKVAVTRSVRVLCIGDIGKRDEALPRQAEVERTEQSLGSCELLVWTGRVSSDEVSRCLAVSSVFLFPVHGGPSGRRSSLMPALSHGLPIVAYEGSERDPEFDEGRTVLLTQPGDPDAMAVAITNLLDDRVLRERLSLGSLELHASWCNWANALDATLGPGTECQPAAVTP